MLNFRDPNNGRLRPRTTMRQVVFRLCNEEILMWCDRICLY